MIAHYRARLRTLGVDARCGRGTGPPRLAAILRHVSLVATAPATATQADLEALRTAGLGPRDIVAITQIVAFVSYQVRVVAGMRALARRWPHDQALHVGTGRVGGVDAAGRSGDRDATPTRRAGGKPTAWIRPIS